MVMARCVVLLSGGLDSATTLAISLNLGFEAYALTVDYGQRHAVEIEAAKRLAARSQLAGHLIVSVGLDAIGGSALTADIAVPKDRAAAEMSHNIPATYVPARNTVLLSLALGYAETIGATDIFVGFNSIDYSGYPDCRPEYVQAFERLARLATKIGVEGGDIRIHAPIIEMSKAQIIELGRSLGVDFGLTHSCYDPDNDGRPCGRCDACLIRKSAFESLGSTDPVLSH